MENSYAIRAITILKRRWLSYKSDFWSLCKSYQKEKILSTLNLYLFFNIL